MATKKKLPSLQATPLEVATVKKKKLSTKTSKSSGLSAPVSKRKTPLKEPLENTDLAFPIVGVGASAGGLEAFSKLLQSLHPKTGMAYVLVQHLDPHHASALTELLSRETIMPVAEVEDGTVIAPDHVYVIPPNANLAILHGILHLMPRSQNRGQHLSIDYFFRSLAEDQGGNAIGVILSGTASDGVLGLKAIKAEGGITFSQDEQSAKYDGMPHSAISAGCVDFILPPEKIAKELMRIARHPYVSHIKGIDSLEILPQGDEELNKIYILLRRHTGVDFTYYKQTTIHRRIRRRMLLHKLDKLSDFVRYMQENPAEVDALYHDMLINVTSFFRDPELFEQLKEVVFPAIASKDRLVEMAIRIWVPGCSTGEEPYSIAMALLEFLGDSASFAQIQIFATDIDDIALEKARAGVYSEAIVQDVSAARLRRFFTQVESGYLINKSIRDMCLFAKQNMVKDPPFSKLDMVSCRNLLIYLGQLLQKKALSLFHYSLKPTGFLVLGTAETIGDSADLFRLVENKHKIYAKKSVGSPLHYDFSMPAPQGVMPAAETRNIEPVYSWAANEIQMSVDRMIMERYGPTGVIVNDDMEILQFRGHTGNYLEPAPGQASLSLLKMAREGLLPDLHSALTQAIKENAQVRKEGVRIKRGPVECKVNIEVFPFKATASNGRYYLVVFQEVPEEKIDKTVSKAKSTKSSAVADQQKDEMERELTATKAYLQSVIEQQESTNEELRSANEEIQSSNEELQSINEELETAKEELQSVNEELATVNEELESRNLELGLVNDDLNNLITSINIPIVIVGRDFRIRRFSPFAEKVLNLIASDIGRPIGNIKPNFAGLNLEQVVADVIDSVSPREITLQDVDGHWFAVRIRPYKTMDNKIDGAIITFIDVDEMKRGYELATEARDFSEAVVSAMRHPLLVLDKDMRVVSASTAYYETFKVLPKDTVGNLLYHLGNGQWGVPKLRTALENVVEKNAFFDNFTLEHKFEHVGVQKVSISGRLIATGDKRPPLVLMQIEVAQ
ncbi:chemotaxis protein CheB [Sulfurirhabdus autotrophica]|uniref:protein-glutamate O-methyltransferase n=1 Tax=Sulfurirhabdus autotrophica TaxID=1706046 RepID=A0A4R3Y5G4_9PROT|nr:chemotaxis protein CheB [Sulfurirhabdus autotrophica]TCV85403.1 two-component system CheB/CheR fusion protein [Sulfurirhabdus autotrophica]